MCCEEVTKMSKKETVSKVEFSDGSTVSTKYSPRKDTQDSIWQMLAGWQAEQMQTVLKVPITDRTTFMNALYAEFAEKHELLKACPYQTEEIVKVEKKTKEDALTKYIADAFQAKKTEEEIIAELKGANYTDEQLAPHFKSLQKEEVQSNGGPVPVQAVANISKTKTAVSDFVTQYLAQGHSREEANGELKKANWGQDILSVEFPELYKVAPVVAIPTPKAVPVPPKAVPMPPPPQ